MKTIWKCPRILGVVFPAPDSEENSVKSRIQAVILKWRPTGWWRATLSLTSFLISGCTLPAVAADALQLKVGPLSETIAIAELETFIETGDLSPHLAKWSVLLTPELQTLLNQRLALDPAIATQFLDDVLARRDGQQLLEELHQALPGSSPEQLETSLYSLLENEEQGLTPLSLVRAYPQTTLQVDLLKASKIAFRLNRPRLQSQALRPVIEKTLSTSEETALTLDFDPTQKGEQAVEQRSLKFWDNRRQRHITVDLYHGEVVQGPLIVLSHGFAADRTFLAYLAEHLASYGFSVVSLEHPGSSVNLLSDIALNHEPTEVLSAAEFIDRPQDVQFILNELERRRSRSRFFKHFDPSQVVVIGHSLGGYTALALAGAELDLSALRTFCQQRSPLGRAPADWLQCSAAKLPYRTRNFRDDRVIQAVAMNPLIGQLFGDRGLEALETPVMITSHSGDTVTPTLEHQLLPFQQITTPKHFVFISGATHMSITDLGDSGSPVAQSSLVQELMGPEVEPVRQIMRALMLAVVQQHTDQGAQYQPVLSAAYVPNLDRDRFTVSISQSLPPTLERWTQAVAQWGVEDTQPKLTWRDRVGSQWQSVIERWQPVHHCYGLLDNIFTQIFRQDPVS